MLGQRVVLKMGGSVGTDDLSAPLAAISVLLEAGQQPIVVHGGGPRISLELAKAGIALPFVDGQRLTTDEAMEIVEEVLCGQVNAEIVKAFRGNGVAAVGLTSREASLLARPLPGMQRTATVDFVESSLIEQSLNRHLVPVIAPVAVSASGTSYNVNADVAAAAIAAATHAERIVFFTDVDGIYTDFANGQRMSYAHAAELRRGLSEGRFQGGMLPKASAVLHAVESGIQAAFVVNGHKAESAVWAVSQRIEGTFQRSGQTPGTCVLR